MRYSLIDSMFINICWKKNNVIQKSLMPLNKVSKIIQEMENKGIKTWFELESIQKKTK